MLRKYVAQILNIYNYIDGLMVVDKKGVVEYYITYKPEFNGLNEKEINGKHVLEIYPELTSETSSFMRVLKDGKPIFNEKQYLTTNKGNSFYAVNTTMPILSGEDIIGAVEVSRYLDIDAQRRNITLSFKDNALIKDKDELYNLEDIITNDNTMLGIKDKINKVSLTDSSVLIYGSTGTGKELVAQAIHIHSNRCNKQFVSQNCAAIPSALLESILFGTVKGSYTGAESRKGLFELAHEGTLFLDEINSMEIGVQAKILKAIEEKKIRRIGGLEYINVDVRVITAINEKPLKAVEEGRLREDLFYRLSVVQINIPSLKERREDVKLLMEFFINKFNIQMNRKIKGVNEKVEEIFDNYSWPGNVRELKNVIEGAFNLSTGGLIEESDIPDYLVNREIEYENKIENSLGKTPLNEMIESYEKRIIQIALGRTKNMVEAANLLMISKQLLKYKMDKYKL